MHLTGEQAGGRASGRQSTLVVRVLARVRLIYHRMRLKALILALLAFAVTGIATGVTARAIKDPPHIEVLSEKLEDYQASHDRYTVVFLGTSRIYRSIIPDIVDSAMRANGCNETSFNMGVEGMFSVERDFVLDKFLSTRFKNLKAIVMEEVLSSIALHDESGNFLSDRVRYYYDDNFLDNFLDSLLSYPESEKRRVKRLLVLMLGYIREYIGVGQLADLMSQATDDHHIYSNAFREKRGYLPLEAEFDSSFKERRRTFVDNVGWIIRERQEQLRLQGSDGNPRLNADRRAAHLARRMEHIAAKGIKPLFLVLPQERPALMKSIAEGVARRVKEVAILHYDDMDKYPELFRRELWFDSYHFTEAGARMVSTYIGKDICQAMRGN